MKAIPLILKNGDFYPCSVETATHVRLCMPCPIQNRVLPVTTKSDRINTPCWTWNGSTDSPTLHPSILTKFEKSGLLEVCHSFVDDGKVQFLSDCTHEFAGQTLDLIDIENN